MGGAAPLIVELRQLRVEGRQLAGLIVAGLIVAGVGGALIGEARGVLGGQGW